VWWLLPEGRLQAAVQCDLGLSCFSRRLDFRVAALCHGLCSIFEVVGPLGSWISDVQCGLMFAQSQAWGLARDADMVMLDFEIGELGLWLCG